MLVLCLIGIFSFLACLLYETNTTKTEFLTVIVLVVSITLMCFSNKSYKFERRFL